MIADYKVICKEVSDKNNVNFDLLCSINNLVFKEINTWSLEPTSLKVYLKHFGSWFYKKQKTQTRVNVLLNYLNYHKDHISDKSLEKINNKIRKYNFILSEYDKYTKERYEIKCQKYGKEAYEAYCMAKKQEKIQKTKKNKSI